VDTESEELRKRFEDATLAWGQDQTPQASPKPAPLSRARLKRLLAAGGKITGVQLRSKSLVVADKSTMSQKEITREQAAAIAADNLKLSKGFRGYQISKVVRLGEIRWARPNLYGVSDEDLDDAWIVYLHDPSFFGLRSSTVMVISRASGHVIYLGSACDEG
jgi:hypothetical protein